MWANRATGCCSFCSSWDTGRPVSTAVELATARSKALGLGVLRWSAVVLIMLGPGSTKRQCSAAGLAAAQAAQVTVALRRRLAQLDDARMKPQADEAASLELTGVLRALSQRPGP